MISSYGFMDIDPANRAHAAQERRLFSDNLDVILEHHSSILNNQRYFFCPLAFSWCTWPYVAGDGLLFLGYLLLGWQNGTLTEPCKNYPSERGMLVTTFGGSTLSGCNWWSGVCPRCKNEEFSRKSVHKPFTKRANFVLQLRKRFPHEIKEWEEFDGYQFYWGGDGLTPIRKRRLKVTRVVEVINIEQVVDHLQR